MKEKRFIMNQMDIIQLMESKKYHLSQSQLLLVVIIFIQYIKEANKLDAIGIGYNELETLVFFMKMTADYNRYLAEIFDKILIYKNNASKYYNDAFKIANEKLKAVDPTLLGLGLNYAVHLYEITKEKNKACDIAKLIFDNAIEQLDIIEDKQYKDATLIMRLLRDNLTLWTSENIDNDD